MDEHEILGQGSMSRLWRVGDTVRRERGPHNDAVAALLAHLEARGYPSYSPRHLGVDDHHRDILSNVPGVPVPTLRGDTQLREVGRAVAGFIAAVADFDPTRWAWRNPESWPAHGDTVVHADIAPWNMLEVDTRLTGLVDFDSARTGRPIEDVAYAAWHMTPLHDEPMGDGDSPPPLSDRPRRLRLFADACGLDAADRGRLLDEVARVQITQAARVAAGALGEQPATARHWNHGRFTANTARSLLWLDHHRDQLAPALL